MADITCTAKTKLNRDYNNVPLQCFTPEPTFMAVTSGAAVDVTSCSVICFDQDASIFFNGVSSPAYVDWPASQPLQLSNKINSVTFNISGTLMYMCDGITATVGT